MSLAFTEILEEVHLLPFEEKIELRDAIDHDLVEFEPERLYREHLESVAEWESGKLQPTSDVKEFMRQLREG